MRKSEVTALVIILTPIIISIYSYPLMPETIASHWNVQGEADAHMSKFWGLFFLPFFSIGLLLLFILIPKIDPLKANVEKFRKYYDGFVVLAVGFFFYLHLLTVFWNVGIRFGMIQFLQPAFAILFYYCGILIENAKMNWFIGIRTPWTLSNEKVWEKTHRTGGKLFKIAGVITLFGVFFPGYAIFFILLPVILVAFYSTAYSYLQYQRQLR